MLKLLGHFLEQIVQENLSNQIVDFSYQEVKAEWLLHYFPVDFLNLPHYELFSARQLLAFLLSPHLFWFIIYYLKLIIIITTYLYVYIIDQKVVKLLLEIVHKDV
jgi:hypothetical protein